MKDTNEDHYTIDIPIHYANLNTDEIARIAAIIFLLMVFAFAGGTVVGAKWEKADAVKAGVAHWVADEKGDTKFEYNK